MRIFFLEGHYFLDIQYVFGNSSFKENLRIRARQLIAAKDEGNWETKRYNVFLSPGQLTIPPNTNQVSSKINHLSS